MHRVEIHEIELTKDDLKAAQDFADARIQNGINVYRRRGGFKKVDIIVGALGELAAYKYLQGRSVETNSPDFTIHAVKDKTFNADLVSISGLHFHVKSQSLDSARKYEASFLFQRTDPIFNDESGVHFLVPVIVDPLGLKAKVFGIHPVNYLIKENLFGECKLTHLRKTKIALYLKELVEEELEL